MIRPEFGYSPHCGEVNPSHEGPRSAQIILIAESPWKTEIALSKPLSGASGHKWDEWLWKAGINRESLRIENLYPYKPPTREITSVPAEELIYWMRDLHRRIAELPGPIVIATMGNYATYALTGKGKVKASIRNAFGMVEANATEAEKKAGISSLRGSIYLYQDLNDRRIKVIPTIHPAAVLQHQKWEKRSLADWKRIREESEFAEYIIPRRNHIIDPSEWQVQQYVRFVEANAPALMLSIDIETWGRTLSCVGFAFTPFESITIPTAEKAQRERFLPYIKRLCECRAEKVLQNGLFDWYWLDDYGIEVANFKWDTQLMHHAFDPCESHSLEFLASVFTKQPYWKDEATDAEEIIKFAKSQDSLWVYNGLDCCVTHELQPILRKELEEREMVEFYLNHYQKLLEPLLRMMRHGTRVDKEKQKTWAKLLKEEMIALRAELEEAAGENLFACERKSFFREPTANEWDLLLIEGEIEHDANGIPKGKFISREGRQRLIDEYGITYCLSGASAGKVRDWKENDKKDFSTAKLMRFFHEKLLVPKQYKRRKGKEKSTETLDEGAIRKMTAKWPAKMGNYGNLLLAYREKKKELDYLKGAWDSDGRMRCSYKMTTEAGRLASAKNPMGRGYNMQNLKR